MAKSMVPVQNNVIGVGIDLVDVDRIRSAVRRTQGRFAASILTELEAEASEPGSTDFVELAARFALKEACLKALGTGIAEKIGLSQVEVSDPLGTATIVLKGAAAQRAHRLGVSIIRATASASGTVASALVVLQGPSGPARQVLR